MNATALIVLLATTHPALFPLVDAPGERADAVGLQVAGLGHYGGVAPIACPDDTFRTPVGHCQPAFEFD